MNKYEMLFILDNGLTDENKQKLIDRFVQVIEKSKGKIVNIDKWGTKKFAYEIDNKNEGYYFLINAETSASVPLEIERQVSITDGAIRVMILRLDEFKIKKTRRPIKTEDKREKAEDTLDAKENFEKSIEVDKEYGAPVIDGVSPEFSAVQNNNITADQTEE